MSLVKEVERLRDAALPNVPNAERHQARIVFETLLTFARSIDTIEATVKRLEARGDPG